MHTCVIQAALKKIKISDKESMNITHILNINIYSIAQEAELSEICNMICAFEMLCRLFFWFQTFFHTNFVIFL